MSAVTVKRNDTAITFTGTLSWTDGPQDDLTGCTVKFIMSAGAVVIKQTAIIVSATARTVRYPVGSTDLAVSGTYHQEWEVTFPAGGGLLTCPTQGKNVVVIEPDAG